MSNHTIHTRSKTFLAVQAALTTLALATPVTDAMAVSGSSVNVSTIAVASIPEDSAYGVASGGDHTSAYQAVSGGSAWDPITGNVGGAFIGGGSANSSGGASGNSATVTGTPNSGSESGYYSVVAGGAFQSGNNEVIDNVAIVSAGTIGTVIGGFQGVNSGTSAVSGNTATLLDGSIIKGSNGNGGDLVGAIAYGSGNTVALNSAVVSGGTVRGNVIGGWAKDGGVATTSNVTSNVAIVSGGSVGGNIIGGYVENTSGAGGAVANSAIVSGVSASVGGGVRGGVVKNSANVTSNVVVIDLASGGAIVGDIIGGYVDNVSAGGSAVSNKVTIVHSGGGDTTTTKRTLTLSGDIYGGKAAVGAAESNVVSVGGTRVVQDKEKAIVAGGYATEGNVTSNAVTLYGDFIQTSAGGLVYGGYTGEGSATSNSATISGSASVGTVYGGYTGSGATTKNSVNVSDQAVIDGGVYGGYTSLGAASSNVVGIALSGGSIAGGILGGYTTEGAVVANSATITNSAATSLALAARIAGGYTGGGAATSNVVIVSGKVEQASEDAVLYGGYTGKGEAKGNTVTLNDGFVTSGSVFGGYTSEGAATANSATISGAKVSIGGRVYGGYTGEGNITSNAVAISAASGGVIGGDIVVGGYSDTVSGNATSNTVVIQNGGSAALELAGNIAGGYTTTLGSATGNTVTVSGNVKQTGEDAILFGGYTGEGAATSNTVSISGGATVGDVYAGYTGEGAATGNTVSISGGATVGDVYAGYTSKGDATSNAVAISGAKLGIGGEVIAGYTGSGTVTSNTVSISAASGGSGGFSIAGGYSEAGGDAIGNSVEILNAGTSANVLTVSDYIVGGHAGSGAATSNTVSISGYVTVGDDVYGGSTDAGDATGNTVNISGGVTVGNVVGGFALSGNATSNAVNISGKVSAEGVYGGGGSNVSDNHFEGNVLTLNGGSAAIGTVANFETVEFNYSGEAGIDVLVTNAGSNSDGDSAVTNLNVSGGTITFDGQIVGGGDLALNSAGALLVTGSLRDELDGDKTYSGGIAINSGALQFQGQTQELTGDITGSAGTFLQIGGGSSGTTTELILAGDNEAYSGTLNVISGGTLSIGSDENIGAGSNVLSGGGKLKLAGESYSKAWTISGLGNTIAPENDVVFSGALSGVSGVGLIVTGDGELTLAANNSASYSGNITVQDGGKLAIENDNNLGASGVGTYTLDDGTLILTGATYSADWTLDNSSTENVIEARYSGVTSFGGLLSGSGGLTIAGSGTLNFTNTSNAGKVTGSAVIEDGGTLLLTSGASGVIWDVYSEGSERTLEGGTLKFADAGTYSASWTIQGSDDSDNPTSNFIEVEGTNNVVLAGGYTLAKGENYATLRFDSNDGSSTSQGLITVTGNLKNEESMHVKVGTPVYLANSAANYDFDHLTVEKTGSATAVDVVNSQGGSVTWYGLTLGSSVNLANETVMLESGAQVFGKVGATHKVTKEVNIEGTNVTYSGGITLVANGATVVLPEVESLNEGEYVLGFVDSAVGNFEGAKFDFDKVSDEALGQVFYTSGGTIKGLEKASGYSGYLTEYVFTAPEASGGYAGVDKKAAEQTKSLSEGFLGGITLLGLGSDLVTDNGIRSAASSVARGGGTGEAFAALGGGRLKHKTGSHVEVSGFNLMAGLAAGVGNGVTVGAFFEYGDGDYDSSNSFSRKVKGSGDVDYAGVGFLGRLDLPKTASGQPYLEATARFGRVKSDFKSDDFLSGNVSGTAKYDVKSNYHGLSFGGGHVWNLGGNSAVDLYGRYVWTRQAGDSAKVKIGGDNEGTVKFSDVDSHRLRVGLRYSNAWSGSNRFYAGAAWEHEFDGEAGARIVDVGKIDDSPDLKGSTGIAEFGFVFNPDRKNLFIDLGIQGYGGKRSGVTGSAQLKYLF